MILTENYCQIFMAKCQKYIDSGRALADNLAEIERINNLPESRSIRLYGRNPIEVSKYQKCEYDKMVKSELEKIKNPSLFDSLKIKSVCAERTLLFIPKSKP